MAFKDTVKEWFKTDLKPSEAQFYNFFNWIRWKDEKIPITDIFNIADILNAKAEGAVVTAGFAKVKVYDIGQMQVFKKLPPDHVDYLATQQPGDYCVGFVYNEAEELEFISADYLGGDVTLKSSYNI